MKRFLALLLISLLLPFCAQAKEPVRVFRPEETEPFPEGAELLTVWVCPLMGAQSIVVTLGEHTMLADAGLKDQYAQVKQTLLDAGVDHLEYAFNSHPHNDHIGGIVPLLQDGFPIDEFITVFPHNYRSNDVNQISTLQALEKAGVPVTDLNTGDAIPFGDAEITVYRNTPVNPSEVLTCNDLSGVLLIRYGECTILLPADLDIFGQDRMIKRYDLKADILQYPHHGTNRTSYAFLKAVDPEYIFFPHGSLDTQDAQHQLQMNAYRRYTFATWGTLCFQTDGTKWIVQQFIDPDKADYVRKYRTQNNIE